jgi:hypothetical protein
MEPYRNFRLLEKLFGVTWRDLVAMEPALEELQETARQTRVICRRWADVDQFFAPIRNAVAGLVGFTGKNRLHPVLGGTKAYEIAYWKLYDVVAGLLPARSRGTEAIRAARKLPPTLAMRHWPRYVPLPTQQGAAYNWADQMVGSSSPFFGSGHDTATSSEEASS